MYTKTKAVATLRKNLDLTYDASTACVNAFLEILETQLTKGEGVELRGFGTFTLKRMPERKFASTLSSKDKIPAKTKIVFTPAKALNDKVNKLK
jgi:DNA-binding protein HU-beta